MFEHIHESRQGDRIISISHNGIALGKSNNIKCDAALFFAFSRAYWELHMKWLPCIDYVAKTFCHSFPIILVRLILMLDHIQEVKTMHSSNFDNYKEIREGFPTNNDNNGIYSKDTANNQARDFFE